MEFADFDFDFDFLDFSASGDDREMSRARAGMPNANVFPLFSYCSVSDAKQCNQYPRAYSIARTYLPVSAIPTTSCPCKAGGQVQA